MMATVVATKRQEQDDDDDEKEWDIIIVGAGQAGMAAAHRLVFETTTTTDGHHRHRDHCLRLLILEATDHVGGRTRNFNIKTRQYDTAAQDDDDVVELGGTWLSPSHTSTLQLLQQLDLEVFHASFLSPPKSGSDDDGNITAENEEEKETSSSLPSSSSPESTEFPWWWWGVDYSEEEMQRLHKIVLHVCHDQNENQDRRRRYHHHHQRVLFSKPQEFLDAFDSKTRSELDYAGRTIDQDCSSILLSCRDDRREDTHNPKNQQYNDDAITKNQNLWEIPTVGSKWKELDRISTAQRFLHGDGENDSGRHATKAPPLVPVLTTPNSRNILRNCIHNKNAEEPHKVSYFYNLISWGGHNSGPGPDTQFRVRGGTQAIPSRIAEKLMTTQRHEENEEEQQQHHPYRCKILFNSPVTNISQEEEKSTKTTKDNDLGNDGSSSSSKEKAAVVVTIQDGQTFRARTAVILTGSPSSIQRHIKFNDESPSTSSSSSPFTPQMDLLLPPSPSRSSSLAKVEKEILENNKMPMGCCIKFMAVFTKRGPWWRHKDYNLQGDILSSFLPQELSLPIPKQQSAFVDGNNGTSSRSSNEEAVIGDEVEYLPIFPYCFDVTPYSQDCGVLCCFLEGDLLYNHFRSFERQQQEELLLEFLRLSFEETVDEIQQKKEKQHPHPSNNNETPPLWQPDYYVIHDWGPDTEPYVGGAYTSYFPPNVLSQEKYWQAFHDMKNIMPPNVDLAGSDYYAGYGNGYIEGAVRSGQEAADRVLERHSSCAER
jgi:monoamine oxidase